MTRLLYLALCVTALSCAKKGTRSRSPHARVFAEEGKEWRCSTEHGNRKNFPSTRLDKKFVNSSAWSQMERIRSATPRVDVDLAIRANDCRFVGIYGVTLIIPGVRDYYQRYSQRFGVKLIENTGEKNSDAPAAFQKVARNYAERYNMALVSILEELGE